jgi:hypothetical protein
MNTLIGFIANPFFGQVRILSPHLEALPSVNSSLMLRSKTVQPIKKIADFGGIESVAVAIHLPRGDAKGERASPHSISPPIPLTAKLSCGTLRERCGGSTPEV